MDDRIIYNPNEDKQNYLFYRFGDNQSIFKKKCQWIRKYGYKTLGTSINYNPMSPPSLILINWAWYFDKFLENFQQLMFNYLY